VVVEFEQIFEALRKDAVQIILSDHHYWQGMTGAVRLGRICQAAGLGVSMHSNSHLGISLAAMPRRQTSPSTATRTTRGSATT
jgi:glucarate dehydratase